MKKNPENGTD